MIELNKTYYGISSQFLYEGERVNPDSVAATLYRNNASTAVVVTATAVGDGYYQYSLTALGTGNGWATTDDLLLRVTMTKDGIDYPLDVWSSTNGASVPLSADEEETLADLRTMIENDGTANAAFTTAALANASSNATGDSELLIETTIATLATQTSFTLTSGSADNDAYNNQTVIVVDQSTATQVGVATVSDYVGSTRTVTLATAMPFTIATGDTIKIIAAGSRSITNLVMPAETTVETRVTGTTITAYTGETVAVSLTVLDADGDARDLSSFTLTLEFETHHGTTIATIADGSITVSGASSNVATFDLPSAVTAYEGVYQWALRETTDNEVLTYGIIKVERKPGV